jgi:thioredoxin-like negative regulator of GroEL
MPRFGKGNAMGAGRPPGSANKSTLLLDEIGREGIEEVIRKVAEAAREGNMRAASILLARAWPRGRGRAVTLGLPAVETAAGIVQAHAALVAAVAAGEIAPEEASAISNLLESQRRALETCDLEKRIEELKAEIAGGPERGPQRGQAAA